MPITLEKYGDGAMVRIPTAVIEAAHLALDEPLHVREEAGRIIIEPLTRKMRSLDSLLAGITQENLHHEVQTGSAVGNEAW